MNDQNDQPAKRGKLLRDHTPEELRKKGLLYFILMLICIALFVTCNLFRGPVAITVAVISLTIAIVFLFFSTLVYGNTVLPRISKAAVILFCVFIVYAFLFHLFLPTLTTRIITVKEEGEWETHFVLNSYDRLQPDGHTVQIPVQRGEVYLENNSSITLEEYLVYYSYSDLKKDYINPIWIAPGEMTKLRGRPNYMFRTPPKIESGSTKGENDSRKTGYYSVIAVAKD